MEILEKFCLSLQNQSSIDVVTLWFIGFYLHYKRKCDLTQFVLLWAYSIYSVIQSSVPTLREYLDQPTNGEKVNGKTKIMPNLLVFWKPVLKGFLVFSEVVTCK